jgi:hypothetical protein
MKKLYITLLALLLALTMVLPAGVASAGSGQIEVSGGFYLTTSDLVIVKSVGKPIEWNGIPMEGTVSFIEITHAIEYTGSFDGSATEVMDGMKNFRSGAFNSIGVQEFLDGEFLGSPGTFTALVRHQGGMDDITRIEMTIISGTGSCENLHGTLIFIAYPHYDPGPPFIDYYEGSYSGMLHYAP